MLLEVASGLPEPALVACPPGPLAEAARRRGLGTFELSETSLELRRSLRDRAAAPARIGLQAAQLRELVRGVDPDLLIAWGMRAALVTAAAFLAGRRPPLLFAHHDLLPGPLVGRAVRVAAARAELVVAASECVARELARAEVLHPGVDLERFRPGEASRTEVLVLGAIEPWKRPDLALEAVALARRELPELTVRIVGAPIGAAGTALLGRLSERAERPDLRGRVELSEAVERPEHELARAGCLLHCAEREPFGMVVAEAMACGRPVVVPDSCGPAEIADPDCGRLYRPGDAADAARALVSALSDASRLGAAGRARAERRLDVRRMQERWAELVLGLGGVPAETGRIVPKVQGPPAATQRAGAPRPAGAGLAVLTVLHDSAGALPALLDSLERHLPGAQLIVVDSGSSDGGLDLARRWRDGAAAVLRLDDNVGFGRAVNAGLALVREPAVALLNPDVSLPDASLAAAAREAQRQPERLIAPLVLRPDGTREDSAQREPGSPALLAHALVPGAALPRRLAAAVEPWRSRTPRRAGWPVGAAVVARTETLRGLGPFDERVFLYAEDLDLGLRAADAGIDTLFWPAARVVHAGAHSTERAFGGEPFELLARRRREVVRERRGPRRAAADDALQLLTFADRLLLRRLAGRAAERERRQIAALREARRDR